MTEHVFDGLYRVCNDPKYGAADIRPEGTLLFPLAPCGRVYHDRAEAGSLDAISDRASLGKWNNTTLAKAAEMIRAGVPVKF